MSNPFILVDRTGKEVPDLFPIPGYNATQSFAIRDFCVLPPAELAGRGLSGTSSPFHTCGGTRFHAGSLFRSCVTESQNARTASTFKPECIWQTLKSDEIKHLDKSLSSFCLPLDDPILVSRGVYPAVDPKLENDRIPVTDIDDPHEALLKSYLQSRNLTVPTLIKDAVVEPVHTSMRLGICVPVPPTNSPCPLDALTAKHTLSPSWGVAAGANPQFPDVALAWPKSELASLVGPRLDAFDHLVYSSNATGWSFPPPLPVLVASSGAQDRFVSWAQPLVACMPGDNLLSRVGTVQKLKMDGSACYSGRQCFSGQCVDRKCSDITALGAAWFNLDRPVVHPSEFGPYVSFLIGETQRPPSYHYFTAYVLSGVLGGMLVLTLLWTSCARQMVRSVGIKLGLVKRTAEERDLELKPVSGAIVGDVGDDESARETGGGRQEEADALPRYESEHQRDRTVPVAVITTSEQRVQATST